MSTVDSQPSKLMMRVRFPSFAPLIKTRERQIDFWHTRVPFHKKQYGFASQARPLLASRMLGTYRLLSAKCGISSTAKHQLPKLRLRVRFPYSAPKDFWHMEVPLLKNKIRISPKLMHLSLLPAFPPTRKNAGRVSTIVSAVAVTAP